MSAPTSRAITITSYASFTLVGWSMLLVPSLIRDIRDDFGQTDAGFGVLYLLASLLFGTGAVLSGTLAGRVGRRVILPTAAIALAVGLAAQGLAPAWPILLVGAALAGGGAGGLDAGVNSVIMDLSVAGRGDALSRLHLFYSVGALTAPLVLGTIVAAGVDWRVPFLASSVVAVALAAPLRIVGAVPPRAVTPRAHGAVAPAASGSPGGESDAPGGDAGRATGVVPRSLRIPLAALAVAIACYVGSEAGVSSWLVAFLADEPLTTATLALSLFWIGLALGRLAAGRFGRHIAPVPYAVASVLLAAIAIAGAVVGPSGMVQIGLFAVAGFGLGPVYPMIMATAGSYYPHRAAAVSGLLTTAGVAGSIIYPPLMGFTSASIGLAAGMLGAAALAGACAVAVLVAAATAERRRAPDPVRVVEAGSTSD
jgi:FHS family glucose/mannose:H+ symporter-like MFS transporter